MEMTGEQLIPLPQETTWRALNDTEILKTCIPGCESIDKQSDNEYLLTMTARVGPVSAKFKGKMTLSEIDPPHAYTLLFEGQGGVAGFAKGQASVRLMPEGDGTKLGYAVKAMVGGKLAQVGARLIDGVAKKLSEQFFSAFNERAQHMNR
jgi:carbon monoxide dehydrogenase subunit G